MTAEHEEKRGRRWLFRLLLLLLLISLGVCVGVLNRGETEVSVESPAVAETQAPVVEATYPPATTSSTTSTTSTTVPTDTAASGTWNFAVHVTGVNGSVCQEEIGEKYERDATISGPEDTVVVIGLDDPDDPEWTGSFKEGRLVFSGTRAEDDGLTTATFEMTLSEDGTHMEGDESWSWNWTSRGDIGTCTEGKSTVTAVRSP